MRQIKIREKDCHPGHRTDVGMIRKVDGPFVDILGIVWTRSIVPNSNLILLCETEFTDEYKPPVKTHIPLVKWTKCTFDAFVEEGYADSGWERETYYINSMETQYSAERAIKRATYQNTEISQIRNLKIEFVSPLAKWDIMSNVYDTKGNLLGE